MDAILLSESDYIYKCCVRDAALWWCSSLIDKHRLTAVLSPSLLSAQRGPASSVFLSLSAGTTKRAGAGRQPVCGRCNRKVRETLIYIVSISQQHRLCVNCVMFMLVLQLWSDTNGGPVHRKRKGKCGLALVHWSRWIAVPIVGPDSAGSGCSSAGCSTATWCVSTTTGTCWTLVPLPCWLPWRTVCDVTAITLTETEMKTLQLFVFVAIYCVFFPMIDQYSFPAW